MSERILRPTISGAFLLSGVAGLIYEVVWSKYLTLFIGGTALAHIIVLATFMGGLALGNAIFGRLADRPGANLLRMYAFLELGIALFCACFPALFARLGAAYLAWGSWAGPASSLNVVLKAGLAVASIFVPCVFMGGTLPVLTKFVTDSLAGLGRRLGWLYFVNTGGAVFGCLLAGFYLIENWGLEFAMVGASLVNLVIGAVFYGFSRSRGPEPAPAASELAGFSEPGAEIAYTPLQARVAFWSIAVAGGLTMLYELVWFRLLVLSIGGTVHSFSTMLAGFVTGIAAGAGLASWLLRRQRNALAILGICELLIGLFTLVPLDLFERLPYAFYVIGSSLVHTPATYSVYMSIVVSFAILLMGVPALLMGAALPMASRVCVASMEDVGRGIGSVFSANTIGNVVGAVLAGLVVLPALGLERTLLLGGTVSGALGIAVLWAWRAQGADRWWRSLVETLGPRPAAVGDRLWPAALVAVAGISLWRLLAGPFWDPRILQSGLYRWESRAKPPSWSALVRERSRIKVLYSRDGADASLLVEDYPPGPAGEFSRDVRVNGKPDAGTGLDMPSQIFVGHLAAFFHPAPREAMVVGLGSGATAAAVLRHGAIRADVAEISPEMVEAARYFKGVNDDVLANPRLSLFVMDARELLLLSRKRYDIIVSEPTNIWVPGVSNLFTRDFYQVVRARLAPGGMFSQWLQSYIIDERMVAATLASLREVFPYVSLWCVRDADLVFLASDRRPSLNVAEFNRRFNQVRPVDGLESADPLLPLLGDPLSFLSHQVSSNEGTEIHWPPGTARPYLDLFPRMEFAAARMQFQSQTFMATQELDERRSPLGREPLFLEEYAQQVRLEPTDRRRLAERFIASNLSLRRLGEAMVLHQLSAGELSPDQASMQTPSLGGFWLLSRELENGVRLERSLERCEAYLTVTESFLAAQASALTRPSTSSFEREVDACITAHPRMADGWRVRAVPALIAAWAPEEAVRRFAQLEEDGTLSRLSPQRQGLLQLEVARALLRLGLRTEARARLDAALSAEPGLEVGLLRVALSGPAAASE